MIQIAQKVMAKMPPEIYEKIQGRGRLRWRWQAQIFIFTIMPHNKFS